ncbi:transposase [Agrilactobacillus composti DSM 18527 = JCM 14202]|uniref:RNA-guided endonuclease TnpB family protein n=1 Tax=Agrilactobacillus composti TaxID=398555 RepID=UPI00042E1331|nr:RNA-guided endonuclease TnpB family protein [Agrilactobacillus composti]GAF39207.1 transposase [Agrilactobacillus composti DSM 18527 = JCM 14202]
MLLSLTVKAKLKLDNATDAAKFQETSEQYRSACNHVAEYIFNNNFELSAIKIQKKLYQDLRQCFGLKSQLAISTIKTTVARYKTVQTQLRRKPMAYATGKKDKKGKEIYLKVPRDLHWLWKPVYFQRPQADLVRNRDWSFVADGEKLSINTLQGRVKARFVLKSGFEQYLDGTWEFGGAKLIKSGTNWFLHIAVNKEFPELTRTDMQHVVGLDRGIRQLVTTYDDQGKTTFFNGQAINRKRRHYKALRTSLQKHNTRNSKRRIRQIGNRENRWMTDINHQLSKTLVAKYGPNTLFVLEDLVNVRFATEKTVKDKRYEKISWAFYQLEQLLTYKAIQAGAAVISVSAAYTSQRCPHCGEIKKTNRKHQLHAYQCSNCGYQSNDDRVGAMNIQFLGAQYVAGVKHPKLKKKKSANG